MATQTTVLQQQTIANTPADWSRTVTFAQFDPTLGTLQDVRIDIAATVDGTVSIESLDATPAAITAGLSGAVEVSTGGTQIAADTVAASGNASLAAYDGRTDYLGNSGTTLTVSQTATTAAVYQPGSVGLSPFIGAGSIDLTASAGIRTDAGGAGSFQLQTAASAGAVVSLQYDYVAAGNGGGGSGSAGSGFTDVISPPGLFVDANAVVTAPRIFTLGDRVTGWSADVPVPQFNSALGTLEAVVLTLTGDVTGNLAIQNLETSASIFDATGTATLALALPGTVTPGVTISPAYEDSGALAGFDGAIDFAGTLVQTLPATTSVDLSDPDDLAGFIGSGTLDLPIAATGTSSLDAPGDVLARVIGEAGGTVAVSYVYLPTGAESGDGGFLFSAGTDPASDLPVVGPTFAPVAVAQTPPFLLPAATFTPLAAAENTVAATFTPLTAAENTAAVTVTTPLGAVGNDDPACFATGTRIATEDGDIPVEALRVGQRVRCLFGGAAPIAWLGQRRIDCRRHLTPDSVWPVRVLAGAFAPGVPGRDLLLSPDHAVYADGVLIPVKYLINDRTVLREKVDTVVYHHVELPRHDILFAEGLAAESFLDTGGKADFEGGSPVRLHPDFWSLKWEANGCVPLVVTGPKLAAARLRLQVRARDLSRSRSPISRSRAARISGSSRSRSSAVPGTGSSSAP